MAKILIIDDEKIIRTRLKKLLVLDGHSASIAENGTRGLEVFRRENPDIVFVDVKMPGMSGIDVLETIKKESPKTEVILITGHGGVETVIAALRKGAFDYITKPIEYDVLVIGIKKAMEKRALEKKLEEHVRGLESANRRIRETQEQLIQSEKMAALGQLAAGVAHEINNPLTAIMMNTAFLLENIPGDGKCKRRLKAIERESDRAAAIVRSLLTFSRKSPVEDRDRVAIDDVIEEILKPVERQLLLKNIEVVRDFAAGSARVRVNVNQLGQVFLNLINNARDAMENGGKLTIRTSHARSTLIIEFSDTGGGIPPENLGKLFTPFFTTKEAGKGVGLGLFVTHSIIKSHAGTITAASEAGRGTTFTISLPAQGGGCDR